MSFLEIALIGVGLSMDAAAISMTNAMVHAKKRARLIEMAALFGLFQGIMPALGYFLGGAFSDVVKRLGGFLVMFILGFIGAKMLMDGFDKGDSASAVVKLTHRLLIAQAVATSIDALAVGISLAMAGDVNILQAVVLIGICTCGLSMAGVKIGSIFGSRFEKKAQLAGGVILILLGIKILLEHLELLP